MATTIAGYQLVEKLHTGFHMVAYRAIREHDKKTFILKLPRSDYPTDNEIASIKHEYHLLKTIDAPGVIKVFELIEQTHYPILVLEDKEGQSLQDYLTENSLDLKSFFKLALQLVDAVSVLHRHNIIHKDIKPANIILEPKSLQIKLIDLSIATQLTEENLIYSGLSSFEGTFAYMSPEQTGRMNRPLDYRTDFYSLGITFFEMLTEQIPFQTNDFLEMVHCHLAKTPSLVTELNPDVPPMLAAVIAKLLAKMPEERYASAVGLKEDLLNCLQEWENHGNIPTFQLGRKDINDHLQISHKLYGRETQIQQLLKAFERVSQQGQSELFLVAGYSGIGKTALIREIYKPLMRQKGYFINGKYEQLQRSTPYTAITTAIQKLVKLVLTDTEERISHIRQNLLKELGNVGQVIIDLIPDVGLIIGKQPAIPVLNSLEAQNRFNFVLQNFIRVFAQPEHPLVIFLDDLQWADSASLSLIENLFADSSTCYLFLIGAYRDNEVQEGHPLLTTFMQLKKMAVPIDSIVLQPLQIKGIENLLADTFLCPTTHIEQLAAIVHEKTLGNPFFINEYLKAFYQERHIWFSYEETKWQWNIKSIEQASVAHNVVDLLITQIHKLPEATQRILKLAACIGHIFDLKTLAIISEQTWFQVAQELWSVMQAKFIFALGETYRTSALAKDTAKNSSLRTLETLYYQFSHDSIQQAAYSLIPHNTRQQTHLLIARLLLKEYPLQKESEHLFTIVNHFNQAIVLLTKHEEQRMLAEYNVWAGCKAKASAAYTVALNYFQKAFSLLENTIWENNYALAYLLYKEAVECEYILRNFEQAERYVTVLLKEATLLDKVRIHLIQIDAYTTEGKNQLAVKSATAALKKLGYSVPTHASTGHILKEMLFIQWRTIGKNISKLGESLPRAKDPDTVAIIELLVHTLPAAYFMDQTLYAFIVCKAINLTLKYGYTIRTPDSCLNYAGILIAQFNQIAKGFDFINLSKKLEKKLGISMTARNHFMMGFLLNHWQQPFSESLDYLQKSYQLAMETGDLTCSSYTNVRVLVRYYLGEQLTQLNPELEKILSSLKRDRNAEGTYYYSFLKNLIQQLTQTFDANHPENEIENLVKMFTDNNKTLFVLSCNIRSQLFYFKGEYSKALELAELGWKNINFTKGTIDYLFAHFFYALCLTACYHTALPQQQRQYWKMLKIIQNQFKLWSQHCPVNFQHLYFLINAEMAQLYSNDLNTIKLYDQAITSAQKSGFVQFTALTYERAALFYLKSSKQYQCWLLLAKQYLLAAHHAYQRWGATAKCHWLEKHYPTLLPHKPVEEKASTLTVHTTITSQNSFEITASAKAALAISSEIELDKLLQKLFRIMIEEAGAERFVLLSKHKEEWKIEADGTMHKQTIFFQPHVLDSTLLPLTLIGYVQRTEKPIIIADAMHDEQTLTDPYVIKKQLKSVLVLPIRYQGEIKRIFYLENNLMTNAFSLQNLQMSELFGTQAAISLENAYLYYQATHDPLTGLANRNLLYRSFLDTVNVYEKNKEDKKIAILFLDLDRFKIINDTLGHEIGDKLLIHVAEQIKTCLREGDIAARLGGDEFVLMMKNVKNKMEVSKMIETLQRVIANPFIIQEHSLTISTSIGVSLYPEHGTDIDTLLRNADIALYKEKELHHH